MDESAESPRERRRRETELTLVREARRLSAEIGLHGFTLEELCDRAGVSRRTFFNYFASKDDAVLGFGLHRRPEELAAEQAFLAGGTGDGDLSATLLDDLATLIAARWASMDVAPETVTWLFAAVDREPRLLTRLLQHAEQMEQADAALIAEREGLPAGDLRARIAAQLMGTLSRDTAGAYLGTSPHDADRSAASPAERPYLDLFAERLAAARSLFPTTPTQPEGPIA